MYGTILHDNGLRLQISMTALIVRVRIVVCVLTYTVMDIAVIVLPDTLVHNVKWVSV